jgi:TolB protein
LKGKILFMSDRGGQAAVYVLDPNSGRIALLTARWPYDMAMQRENLSPDGQARAFVQNDGRGVPQVYVYSQYYGGTWQVTFNTGMSYDPVWSPAGDRLAYVSTEGGNDDVYVVDTDGKNQQRLTFNQWEWDKHPSWSPDGTQIVFWSNQDSGRKQLWIVNADGTNRRLLLNSPYDDWDPVWIKVR